MQSQLHWAINIHARVTIINLIKDQRLLGIHLFIRTFQPAKSSAWSHRLNKQNYTSQTIQYLDFIKKKHPCFINIPSPERQCANVLHNSPMTTQKLKLQGEKEK